jgi:hypothetical protein
MHAKVKKLLVGVLAASAAVAIYTLTIGMYPRHFSLEWDEEVQLHDGRLIVVHVKHTYERLHNEFGRYTSAIPRSAEITFEPKSVKGPITQVLMGGKPMLLDQHAGNWLLVFSWTSQWSPHLLGGQNWGPDQNGNGQRVAILDGATFKPTTMCSLPDELYKPNLLSQSAGAEVLSKFDGQRITLQQKQDHLRKHPPSYGEHRIERPTSNTCK